MVIQTYVRRKDYLTLKVVIKDNENPNPERVYLKVNDYNLEGYSNIAIDITKPSGYVANLACPVTDNSIVFDINRQLISELGTYKAQIKINEEIVLKLVMYVYDNIVEESGINTANEIRKLKEQVLPEIEDIVNWSPQKMIEKMGAGWNLSNTLESWHLNYTTEDTSYWETLWGNPVTTKAMIESVKKRGFNTVRIPVTWVTNIDSNSRIMEGWLNRVEEVVNYVLDCGMFCIINVHHDTGADGVITAEFSKIWSTMYTLENLWLQIGARFAKYDYRLIFEGLNEILNPHAANLWYGDPDSYKAVNMLNQLFVDTVRGMEGNESRFLLCAPYGAQFQEGPLAGFEMPIDSASNKIIIRINLYNSSRESIYKTAYTLDKYIHAKGKCCIITEMGVENYDNVDLETRIRVTRMQAEQFRKMGIGMVTWADNLNRNDLTWKNTREVDALIDGYKRYKKQATILDSSFDVMDINNYRGGEYSFTTGIFSEGNTKVCFKSYVVPAYNKYSVTTSVNGLVYMITQLDEYYNYITVSILGNYGGFDIRNNTKYLGITLYSDSKTYTMAQFEDLLKTASFSIVPRVDAISISPGDMYYKKSEVDAIISELTARIHALEK